MAWLLDTNVVSEPRKRKADAKACAWIQDHSSEGQFISVITLGEIRYGIERIRPRDPQQAQALETWFLTLKISFGDRILPVTESIADTWGRLSPAQPLPESDGLIAATALEHGLTVVTRNVADFQRCGVAVVNPFE